MKKTISSFLVVIMLIAAFLGLDFKLAYADSVPDTDTNIINIEGVYGFKQKLDAEAALIHPEHQADPKGTEYFYAAEFRFSLVDNNSIKFDGSVFNDINMHTGEVDGVAYKISDNMYKYKYNNEYLLFKFSEDKLIIEESIDFSFRGARVTFAHEYKKNSNSNDDVLKIESNSLIVNELNNNTQVKDVLNKLSFSHASGMLPQFNNINQVTDDKLILLALKIGVYEKNFQYSKEYVDSTLKKLFGKSVTKHQSVILSSGIKTTYNKGKYSPLPGGGAPGLYNRIYKAQKINNRYLLAIKTSIYNPDFQDEKDAEWDGNFTYIVLEKIGGDYIVNGVAFVGAFGINPINLNTLVIPAIKVTLNGKLILFDQLPISEKGNVLVPIKAIFEAMGATLNWDGSTKIATGTSKNGYKVAIKLNSEVATIDGFPIKMGVIPKSINGTTMAPLKFVVESLGGYYTWDAKTYTAAITTVQDFVLENRSSDTSKLYKSSYEAAMSSGRLLYKMTLQNKLYSVVVLNSGYISKKGTKFGYVNDKKVVGQRYYFDKSNILVKNLKIAEKLDYAYNLNYRDYSSRSWSWTYKTNKSTEMLEIKKTYDTVVNKLDVAKNLLLLGDSLETQGKMVFDQLVIGTVCPPYRDAALKGYLFNTAYDLTGSRITFILMKGIIDKQDYMNTCCNYVESTYQKYGHGYITNYEDLEKYAEAMNGVEYMIGTATAFCNYLSVSYEKKTIASISQDFLDNICSNSISTLDKADFFDNSGKKIEIIYKVSNGMMDFTDLLEALNAVGVIKWGQTLVNVSDDIKEKTAFYCDIKNQNKSYLSLRN